MRSCAWLVAVFTVVAPAAPAWGDPASDDPAADYAAAHGVEICRFLAEHPTGPGVVALLRQVVADTGLSVQDAGTAVGDAVKVDCPQDLPFLRAMTEFSLY
ncbi:hypothetical protein KIH27_02395 [Mycobacterium sp. M1]|uniref:DUF732 domain-containing protein n=1 Tax=Mycolicibacter acidiphilus TaxID=2835306 RepID=A0ABS5RDR7_9MYCO|nr:DUF732 domain-containing protein [Mycolicibacter acidiphilus]MBS9532432.1 hypothetical protein [Mycolicibacter acidiphilus]